MKVTTIEEAQDICNMKVEELMGSLQTFEMAICDKADKKKSIAFNVNTEKSQDEDNESITDDLVMLGRQFNKVFSKMDWKSKPDVKNMMPNISKDRRFQK